MAGDPFADLGARNYRTALLRVARIENFDLIRLVHAAGGIRTGLHDVGLIGRVSVALEDPRVADVGLGDGIQAQRQLQALQRQHHIIPTAPLIGDLPLPSAELEERSLREASEGADHGIRRVVLDDDERDPHGEKKAPGDLQLPAEQAAAQIAKS